MDYNSYVQIISNRGDIPLRDVNGEPYALYAFKQDLLSNKMVWVNNYKQDLLFILKTHHSLFSIFYGVKYHPYKRIHRFIIFISSLCLSVLFSSLIVTFNKNQKDLISNILYSILSAMIISIYNSFTKLCLLCSCSENTNNKCFQCICKSIGFVLAIYIQLFNAILYLFAGIAILKMFNNNTKHFWIVWNISNITAYLIEMLIITIYFNYRWKFEHSLFINGNIQEKLDYYVTFDEYDRWNNGNYLNISLSSSPDLSDQDDDDDKQSPNNNNNNNKHDYLKIYITPQRL